MDTVINVDSGSIISQSNNYERQYDSCYTNANPVSDSRDNEQLNNNDANVNIFRYKFTNEFTDELFKFSKVHQYDHRKDFKEAWNIWVETNDDIVNDEVRRLSDIGYDGDIMDKMYKSARYYFRKKSTEKKEPTKRRMYVGTHKELLEAIDDHIRTDIRSDTFKPSISFDEFCKKNVDLLKVEVTILRRAGITDSEFIQNKIKKTFKNRYFLVISK